MVPGDGAPSKRGDCEPTVQFGSQVRSRARTIPDPAESRTPRFLRRGEPMRTRGAAHGADTKEGLTGQAYTAEDAFWMHMRARTHAVGDHWRARRRCALRDTRKMQVSSTKYIHEFCGLL